MRALTSPFLLHLFTLPPTLPLTLPLKRKKMNQKASALRLKIVEGGYAIARWSEQGFLEQLSFPFDCIEKAREFLAIASYELKFIPSVLPHIQQRFHEGQ